MGFEWPDVVIQKLLHSARVTIWCALSRHGILGPYFVEDDAQNLLTVNQEHYREIIIAPFVRDLKHFCRVRNLPLQQRWMQQDGATAHTAGESLACLQQHFGDHLISRGIQFPFPSHSADLMAPDDPPGNVPELREKLVIFCVFATTCVHHHVQQSAGSL